jgi:hypothetical protein
MQQLLFVQCKQITPPEQIMSYSRPKTIQRHRINMSKRVSSPILTKDSKYAPDSVSPGLLTPLNKARFSDSYHRKAGNHRRSGSRAVFPLGKCFESPVVPVGEIIHLGWTQDESLTVEKGSTTRACSPMSEKIKTCTRCQYWAVKRWDMTKNAYLVTGETI